MKRTAFLLLAILVVSSMMLSACGGGASPGETNGGTAAVAADRPTPPSEYANKTNPHDGDAASAEAGKTVFANNCASCHGEAGRGDGPAAAALDPKPQNLAETQSGLSDGYLAWRISEGGAMEPFKSAMPAWKALLSEDEIWQAITFIRTLK